MGEQRPEYRDVRGFIPETLQRGFQPFWVTPDDLLITRIQNTLVGVNVSVSGRIWHADGSVNEFTFTYVPTSDGLVNNFAQQLEWGWLTSLVATPAGATLPARGQTLVSIVIARPPAATFTPKWLLAQDYLTQLNGPYFPYGRSVEGVEGPGILRSIVGTAAVGADWVFGVPAGRRWRIRSIIGTLVTAVTPATRQVELLVTDNLLVPLFRVESASTQLASLTQVYDFIPGTTLTALINTHQPVYMPLDLQLRFGWTIRSNTVALQALDQWSNIELAVEEWIES